MQPKINLYVLDTNTVTYLHRGNENLKWQIQQAGSDRVATTIVTLYEQLRGRIALVNRKQSEASLMKAFEELRSTHSYYCKVQILQFDEAAAVEYRSLLQQKIRIGVQDLRIAAIVLANKATLITSNLRDFQQIPDLQIADWSQAH